MSRLQNHKIHTASLQIDFEGLEEGLGIQDEMALFFYEKVVPQLELIFDQYNIPGGTLTIDKLTLACGKVNHEEWEKNLLQKVQNQVKEEIRQLQIEKRGFTSFSKQAEDNLLHFLQKGYFLWNSPFASPKELESYLIIDQNLINSLIKSKIYRNSDRLCHSLSPRFVKKMIESLSENTDNYCRQLIGEISITSNASINHELLGALLRSHSLSVPVSFSLFLNEIVSNFSEGNLLLVADFLDKKISTNTEINHAVNKLFGNRSRPNHSLSTIKIFDMLKDKALKKGISSENEQANNQGIDKDGIYIENAGLVLLHPFLPALFENAQLISNGQLDAKETKNTAANILHYLVYGDKGLPENHYPLNKLLSGMEIEEVCETSQKLPVKIQELCDELLMEMIGHWKVLKNTSIDGLRETFLERNGKITRAQNGWKLTVEQKTVDVLLGSLPWGIGIIKLPWMKELLYVEWA